MEFEEIVKFKDVIEIKQFFWEQEKLFEKTKKKKMSFNTRFNK